MQKKWLYRLILSYLPIFLTVVFCLILTFFLTLGETTKRQTVQANRVFAGQVMQIVDATLQNVDTMASKGLLLNGEVVSYFDESGAMGTYDYYRTTNALLDFMAPLPMVDSVYLYRQSDGKILMQSFSSQLGEFGDDAFIRQVMDMPRPNMWSEIRNLTLFPGDEQNRSVISLVKRVPYFSGEQGLIVINIRSSSLQALVQDMQIEGGAKVCLADQAGHSFANPGAVCPSDKDGAYALSALSGFQVNMDLQKGNWLTLLSSFTYIWFGIGLVAVIAGIVAMTYISHRHYRPLEQLLERVQTFGQRKNSLLRREEGDDDFSFIDHALESLIAEANSFEQQQAEGLVYRRTHFFKELLEGNQVLSGEEFHEETQKLGVSFSVDKAIVGIVEMDYYEAFASEYSIRDQSLFKFAIRSVIQEIAVESGESLWAEWIGPNRLGLLYWRSRTAEEKEQVEVFADKLASMSDKARQWVEQYLKFTVTVGLGREIREVPLLSASYDQAELAVDRKIATGPNRVYRFMEPGPDGGVKIDAVLQELKEAAQLYRLGNPDWQERLNNAFLSMAGGEYGKEDIARFIHLFKAQLIREMQDAPQELQRVWREEGLAELQAVTEQVEWMEEARLALVTSLAATAEKLQDLRTNREQYSQAALVRQYIAEHFRDPNLSLAQIGEQFGMNQKTLSRIFKEEFGEKFVDYLTRLRLELAKELLEKTPDSVQSISEYVGYLYPMSFIRVFKKVEGVTPGDYRKEREARAAEGR